jgi:solute carrier family 25 folate transporter 32
MQNMSSDTHDHGPPNTIAAPPESSLGHKTPTTHPRLALWSLNIAPSWINPISGATSGAASAIVTCPLDVIKTKLQAQGAFRVLDPSPTGPSGREMYRGMLGTAKTIVRQDGLIGMYRGLSPMMLGYLPTWAVYMTVYDKTKGYFNRKGWHNDPKDLYISNIYSAVSAGACSTLATNPIWVIKTRMMSQVSRSASKSARAAPWHYNSTLDAARKMYKSEGMGAFYSGLAPALLGLTHVAIQFPLYEYLKEKFVGLEMGETSENAGGWNETFGILAATLISKVCATSATYPHEVLRTRLQTQQRHFSPEGSHDGVSATHHSQNVSTAKRVSNSDGSAYRPRYQGVLKTFKVILREEGWRAFYNGMGTNMIRAVPAAMTTLLTYETVKGMLDGLHEEGKDLKSREEYS